MKTSLICLAIIASALTACGSANQAASSDISSVKTKVPAKSGTAVNNGILPDKGPSVSCQGQTSDGEAIKFSLNGTMIPTYVQAALTFGDSEPIEMNCVAAAPAKVAYPDQAQKLWSCVEARNGEGRLRLDIHTQGMTAMILGDVSREQMFPLQPAYLRTLGCKAE